MASCNPAGVLAHAPLERRPYHLPTCSVCRAGNSGCKTCTGVACVTLGGGAGRCWRGRHRLGNLQSIGQSYIPRVSFSEHKYPQYDFQPVWDIEAALKWTVQSCY